MINCVKIVFMGALGFDVNYKTRGACRALAKLLVKPIAQHIVANKKASNDAFFAEDAIAA